MTEGLRQKSFLPGNSSTKRLRFFSMFNHLLTFRYCDRRPSLKILLMLNHLLANVLEQFSQNESAVRQVSILPVDAVLAHFPLISDVVSQNLHRSLPEMPNQRSAVCWFQRKISVKYFYPIAGPISEKSAFRLVFPFLQNLYRNSSKTKHFRCRTSKKQAN